MHPPRLGIILLVPLLIVLAGVSPASAQQRQRRVFTNDDLPAAASPPAPPAPAAAAPAAAPAEGTPAAEGTPSGGEDAKPEPAVPPALKLSNSVQITLREFHTELAAQLEQEIDPARQERLRLMMDLTVQLLARSMSYMADLKAQQAAATEAEAQAQAGAP